MYCYVMRHDFVNFGIQRVRRWPMNCRGLLDIPFHAVQLGIPGTRVLHNLSLKSTAHNYYVNLITNHAYRDARLKMVNLCVQLK